MKTLALVLAGLVTVLFAGVLRPEPAGSGTAPEGEGITVTGTASVAAVPDEASFSFGVESRGATARAALAANAAEMRRVIAALRAAGVAAADLQTQQVALSPLLSSEGHEVTGYVATNAVSARLRDLARAGAVVDAAVEAGANQVYGPSLSRSNAAALYRDALKGAYADARAKAQALADAADMSLGTMIAVVEAGGGGGPVPVAEDAARSSAPIEPGIQEIQASVTATFAAG